MGYHFSGMLREINQQVEFLWSQVNFFAAREDFAGRNIDVEFSRLDHRRFGCTGFRSSPQMSSHSRQELFDPKWLRNVIIRPGVECLHFHTFLAPNRQDDNRSLTYGTQPAA